MIVVDASTVVEYLVGGRSFERLRERIDEPGQHLHAPHLLDIEVLHALRRLTLQRSLEAERADDAVRDFAELRVMRYPASTFLSRVWQLRHNVAAFDAVYVALAEALDAPLITTDARLARALGHDARIELVV